MDTDDFLIFTFKSYSLSSSSFFFLQFTLASITMHQLWHYHVLSALRSHFAEGTESR